MPRLRRLSGPEVVRIFESFGFEVVSQRGSHIKLRRVHNGERQTLNIPNHRQLKRGTTAAIFHEATKYVPPEELRTRFYAD